MLRFKTDWLNVADAAQRMVTRWNAIRAADPRRKSLPSQESAILHKRGSGMRPTAKFERRWLAVPVQNPDCAFLLY